MRLLLVLMLVVLGGLAPARRRPALQTGRQARPLPKVYRAPNRLGPYKIDADTPLTTLWRVLGRPQYPGDGYWCYEDVSGKTFLWVEPRAHDSRLVGALMLTTFPNCRDAPVAMTQAAIGAWRTGEGIGLGSGKTEIVSAYGSPFDRWWMDRNKPAIRHIGPAGAAKPSPGTLLREWGYGSSEDLRFVHFGFDGDRVTLIFIGNNE